MSVADRAAEVIDACFVNIHPEWVPKVADALAAAGLLVTEAVNRVVEAAKAETAAEAEFARYQRGPRSLAEPAHRALRAAQYARHAAVRALREDEQ